MHCKSFGWSSAVRLAQALPVIAAFVFGLSEGFADEARPAPFPGKQSEWNGFRRYDFEVDGKPALVVAPDRELPGRPWVWHGEFFGHKPAPDVALLKRGFHIVYLRVPDMLGSPQAVAHWNAFYQELTTKYDFAKKAALVGLSRGGLYCYSWAAANPDKVACIYGDAPVCDFKSWPGGKGKGKGSARDWKLVLERYGFADEAAALVYDKNPVDSLAPLAKASVPLLHVYGDADDVVPWDENTGVVAERYRKLGGSITLIAKPGVGHHPHGLDDPTPIVDFIARHATPQPAANPADAKKLHSAAANVRRIVAHRGSSIDRPENTRASTLRAIEVGATAVEVDVRTTRDGRLVLSHDADISRISDGTGLIEEKTWEELRRLDVGSKVGPQFAGERIPSLDEILELCRGKIDVLLDLKEQGDDFDQHVVDVVRKHGEPRRTIVGVRSVEQARRFRQLLPEAQQIGLIGKPGDIEAYAAAGVETIRLWPKWLGDTTLVGRVRKSGKQLHLNGTSGDAVDLAQLLVHRPESISGDDPARIVETLRKFGGDQVAAFAPRNDDQAPKTAASGILWQGIPGLERTARGRVFASWFTGGEKEPASENEVRLSYSDDQGRSFTSSQVMAGPKDGGRAFDPALWIDPRGRLWYLFNRGNKDAAVHQAFARICDDPDATPPVFGPEFVIDLGVPYVFRLNKLTVLSSGEWIMPVTHAAEPIDDWFAKEKQRQGVAISTDEGRTWRLHGSLQAPFWALECMITELRDGRLWLLTRTGGGFLWESYSSDKGRTWSNAAATTIASPGSRFFIRRLRSGNLLLVNHYQFTKRSHLTARVSTDEGKTWNDGLLLDERVGVSYPDGVQDSDGLIWIIYDHDRRGSGDILLAKFREEDVVAGKNVSSAVELRQTVSTIPSTK